jgi:hypothetical protein
MAEMAVLGMFFERLYTTVNGAGNRDINIRCSSTTIRQASRTSAPSKSGPMRPDMSRHLRLTESFLPPGQLYKMLPDPIRVRRRGIDRCISKPMAYGTDFSLQAKRFPVNEGQSQPGCSHSGQPLQPNRQKPSQTRSDTRSAKGR